MNRSIVIAGLVLLIASRAAAQQERTTLTLEGALERARQTSPALVAARMRIEEARGPLAVVMIGGLVTSTLFTLFALPAFYAFVHRWQEWRGLRPN